MFVTFATKRPVSVEELKEIVSLMELQETTDKYTSTSLSIDGNDASIEVEIDAEGNVTLI